MSWNEPITLVSVAWVAWLVVIQAERLAAVYVAIRPDMWDAAVMQPTFMESVWLERVFSYVCSTLVQGLNVLYYSLLRPAWVHAHGKTTNIRAYMAFVHRPTFCSISKGSSIGIYTPVIRWLCKFCIGWWQWFNNPLIAFCFVCKWHCRTVWQPTFLQV
jgi:hypothetical protein